MKGDFANRRAGRKTRNVPDFTRQIIRVSLFIILLGMFSGVLHASFKAAVVRIEPVSPHNLQEAERTEIYVQFWERHLRMLGLKPDVIPSPSTYRTIERYNLLVIPGTTSLTRAQTDNILRFLDNGNNVILCQGAGNAVADDQFDRNTLASNLGLTYRDLPKSDATTWRVMLETPQYLTATIPRLQMIDVEVSGGITATSNRQINGFWIDPHFRDDDFGYWEDTAAIIKGDHNRGKFVWLGFTFASVGGDLPNSEAFYRFSKNILNWFSNSPVVEVNPWPNNYKGALTLSMDTETAFSNINRMLQVDNLPNYTLFILTNPARMYMDLLRSLSKDERCELAVHGDSHEVFRSQPVEEQLQRLMGIRKLFREETGVNVVGFRPPEEAYDYFTLQSLAAAGFEYIFADDRSDRAEPKIIRVFPQTPGKTDKDYVDLVQFPMLNKDDIKLIMIPGRTDIREIYESYMNDIELIIPREGLYMANFHTHVLVNPNNLPVLQSLVHYLEGKSIWIPIIKELASWWRLKNSVSATLRDIRIDPNNKRASLVVENFNNEEVTGVTVSFWSPSQIRSFSITDKSGRSITDYHIEEERVSILLPQLDAISRYEFTISWQE